MDMNQDFSMESVLNGKAFLMTKDGKIQNITVEMCELLGLSKSDVIGKNVQYIFDADIFKFIHNKEFDHFEILVTFKSDQIYTLTCEKQMDQMHISLLEDKTDIKKDVKPYSDFSCYDFIDDLVFVKDLDHNYVYCNTSFYKMHKLKGKNIFEVKDPLLYIGDDFRRHQETDALVFMGQLNVRIMDVFEIGEDIVHFEIVKSPIFDDFGKLKGIIGIGRDISKYKKNKNELSNNEAYIEDILLNLNLGYARHEVIFDNQGKVVDYRFLDVNKKFEQLTGLERDKILKKRVLEVMPLTEPYWIEVYGNVATSGVARSFEEYSQSLDQTFNVYAFSPQVNQFIVVISDVTEIKRFERELFESHNLLSVANQAKDIFLANMSHEIRTPLNGIVGLLRLLMNTDLNEDQEEYARRIETSISTLGNLFQDILDYAQISEGLVKTEECVFNIKEVMDEILRFYEASLEMKRLTFSVVFDKNIPIWFFGDRVKVRQILINLVGNALKFTSMGKIEVNISFKPSTEGKGQLILGVKDTGIGIEDDKVQLIFEAFQQGDSSEKKAYSGIGLGLTRVGKLLGIMGGHIDIVSQVNLGTTITASIPMAAKYLNGSNARLNGNEKNIKNEKEAILIVDDDPVSLMILKMVLENMGYHVIESQNGLEAVESIRKNKFKIVFMDIEMPVMNGFEATKFIKNKLLLEMPIVAITGYPTEENRDLAEGVGFDAFLSKPISRNILIDKLGRYL